MANEKPEVGYWHLHVDADGVSHHKHCVMSDFEMKPVSDGAKPQWNGSKTTARTETSVVVLPVGWEGGWHENPHPQWIIPLSGRWFVEAMDGERREFGPGEISFGEDQGCVERDGKKGHGSGTVGDEPAVLMIVQFVEPLGEAGACRFK